MIVEIIWCMSFHGTNDSKTIVCDDFEIKDNCIKFFKSTSRMVYLDIIIPLFNVKLIKKIE